MCRTVRFVACGSLLFCGLSTTAQTLVDVSALLGVENILDFNDHGKGVSFHDIDGDGWDDLSISTGEGDPLFFLNQGGTFTPAPFTIPNPQAAKISMLLWADFDNDGDKDLFISKYIGPVELWRNDGNWQFTNITAAAGIHTQTLIHAGATVADMDHDGCLDLYIARFYGSVPDPADPIYQGVLYRGNCDLTFTDVTATAGLLSSPRPAFMPVFMDYDNDGWEDLLLIVDRTSFSNLLYRNNGDGTFSDVSAISGMDLTVDAMTGTVGDPDNDGDLDVFITNTPQEGGHLMMVNQGDGTFVDQADTLGLGTIAMGWGGVWMDLDNNGWEDLFVSITNTPEFDLGNQFHINQQGTGFVEASQQVGLWANPIETYTAARGDLDNDGFYDLITNNRAPHNTALYRNTGGPNHHLSVSLQGVLANRDGIGSWIHCHANGLHMVRYTQCGSDYMAQSSGRYIFGLGEAMQVDSLEVHWNSGTRDVYYNVPADQHLLLVEGASLPPITVTIIANGSTTLCLTDTLLLDAGEHDNYLWNTGHTGRFLQVTQPGIYQVTVTSLLGQVAVSEPVPVDAAPPLTIIVDVQTISCHGLTDGAITVSVSNEPVQWIQWNTGATGATQLTALAAGGYSFELVDSFGCPGIGGGFVVEPMPLLVDMATTDVLCAGEASGTAVATIAGGTLPYALDWSGLDPLGLPAGTHVLLVTDTQGCSTETIFTIQQPTALALSVNTTPDQGDGQGGSANAQAAGGTPPYAISWSTGQFDTWMIDDLAPGTYHAMVIDANDCAVQTEFTIMAVGVSALQGPPTFGLFPNPTYGPLWLTGLPPERVQALLLDLTGRSVAHFDLWGPEAQLDLGGLPAGTYLLGMTTPYGYAVARFALARR